MFSDRKFSDGMFSDRTFSDGTFTVVMGRFVCEPFSRCAFLHSLYYMVGNQKKYLCIKMFLII